MHLTMFTFRGNHVRVDGAHGLECVRLELNGARTQTRDGSCMLCRKGSETGDKCFLVFWQ